MQIYEVQPVNLLPHALHSLSPSQCFKKRPHLLHLLRSGCSVFPLLMLRYFWAPPWRLILRSADFGIRLTTLLKKRHVRMRLALSLLLFRALLADVKGMEVADLGLLRELHVLTAERLHPEPGVQHSIGAPREMLQAPHLVHVLLDVLHLPLDEVGIQRPPVLNGALGGQVLDCPQRFLDLPKATGPHGQVEGEGLVLLPGESQDVEAGFHQALAELPDLPEVLNEESVLSLHPLGLDHDLGDLLLHLPLRRLPVLSISVH